MTTLISYYTSGGCEGRCDARCYNAKHPECTCICGGRNHGVGIEKALENTREMAESWIEEYALTHDLERAEVNQSVFQLAMTV